MSMDTPSLDGSVAVLPRLVAELHDVLDQITAAIGDGDLSRNSDAEVIALTQSIERANRRVEAVATQPIVEVSDRGLFRKAGYRSLHWFLVKHLRVTDPKLRQRRIAALGEFTSMTGERKEPDCPTL
ncbi:MAG: hypothetical protein QM662_12230, partial [Gordonia sp. (in: high G+C Gram-positive bacteria)]